MTLHIGTLVGPNEITATVGAGGMGEVYRDPDSNLGRDVAIKILPVEFAQDADRRMRFEREARLLASLNHPHIAHVYGLEAHESSTALVMVEGDDLKQHLERGPMAVEDACEGGRISNESTRDDSRDKRVPEVDGTGVLRPSREIRPSPQRG
ncbi:MAG: protein kinase [Acidobacteria bacterium]|nr:protein kinase [Acidobacteriota bacterium]